MIQPPSVQMLGGFRLYGLALARLPLTLLGGIAPALLASNASMTLAIGLQRFSPGSVGGHLGYRTASVTFNLYSCFGWQLNQIPKKNV